MDSESKRSSSDSQRTGGRGVPWVAGPSVETKGNRTLDGSPTVTEPKRSSGYRQSRFWHRMSEECGRVPDLVPSF